MQTDICFYFLKESIYEGTKNFKEKQPRMVLLLFFTAALKRVYLWQYLPTANIYLGFEVGLRGGGRNTGGMNEPTLWKQKSLSEVQVLK